MSAQKGTRSPQGSLLPYTKDGSPVHEISSTAAIILAAGSSSRMGSERHKLLLPLGGRSVLEHVLEATLASKARPIVVVLGHQSEQVRERIGGYTEHADVFFVENANYLQGMSTSMRVGLQAVVSIGYRKNTCVDSALIILGDQPLVTGEIMDELIKRWRTTEKHIVAPMYAGKRGNPMLFAASLFGELMEVEGDEGGRSVVQQHREELEMIELENVMANYDVDTWEAYQQVVEVWQGKEQFGK